MLLQRRGPISLQIDNADALRLVGEWELKDLGNGEASLRAVAHAAPAKK